MNISRTNRLGALSGAAFVIFAIVGNAISGSTSSNPTAASALADFQKQARVGGAATVVGLALATLGPLLFLLFLGFLCARLRDAEGHGSWLPLSALTGGLGMVVIELFSGIPSALGTFLAQSLTPDSARMLADMANIAFVISWLPFAVFLVAAGASIVRSHLPQPFLGWTAIVLGVLCVLSAALTGGKSGINANPMPYLLGLIWVAVVSVVMAVRHDTHAARVEPIAAPKSVAARP